MRLVGPVVVALAMTAATAARADVVHLEHLNVDVDLPGTGWAVTLHGERDIVTNPDIIYGFGLGPSECRPTPAAVPLPCPEGFQCNAPVSKDSVIGMTAWQTLPDGRCFAALVLIPEAHDPSPVIAGVLAVKRLVLAGKVAEPEVTFGDLAPTKLAIRTGDTARDWRARPLAADDADAPVGTFVYDAGAAADTGVAVTQRTGACPAATAASNSGPWPMPVVATSPTSTTLCFSVETGRSWLLAVRWHAGDDVATVRRWAAPVVVSLDLAIAVAATTKHANALIADLRGAKQPPVAVAVARPARPVRPPSTSISAMRVYVAGARISPAIADAAAFGAARVGGDLIVGLGEGALASAIAIGTSLGCDGSFHVAADIYVGVGAAYRAGGVHVLAAAIAGADRDGPDSASTFAGRGYLGAVAAVRLPLGIAALDVDGMWNTQEERFAAGIVPRGVPLVAGLMIDAYDQSTAVMVYVGVPIPY